VSNRRDQPASDALPDAGHAALVPAVAIWANPPLPTASGFRGGYGVQAQPGPATGVPGGVQALFIACARTPETQKPRH
jgi:hypothetical protein